MERNQNLMKISKKLSWALRHGIKELNLTITPAGYVKLSDLLSNSKFKSISQAQVEMVVKSCEKQRFNLSEIDGHLMIRANQGHTITGLNESELLTPIENPYEYPTIVHGTNIPSWNKIKSRGLYRMNRNHIHFALNLPGHKEVISGARVKCDVFIFVDIEKCMNDGMKFFISQNKVVLSSGFNGFITPEYFSKVLVNRVEQPLNYQPIDFDYYCVLDFEANCIENGTLKCQEIIEFPVQVLNSHTKQVDFTFHKYVKPEVEPVLSAFCTSLTGIEQTTVENQGNLAQVLSEFYQFLIENRIDQSRWIFVTCGDWDLKTCLAKEAEYKKIPLPDYFSNWINIKFIVPAFKGGMMELIQLLEIEHVGRHHSGIDDVRNIKACLVELLNSKIKISIEDIRGDLNKFRSRFNA